MEKKVKKNVVFFLGFRSDLLLDPNPDPLFHETDPRIRIQIKMKWIRNTEFFYDITPNLLSLKCWPGKGENMFVT